MVFRVPNFTPRPLSQPDCEHRDILFLEVCRVIYLNTQAAMEAQAF